VKYTGTSTPPGLNRPDEDEPGRLRAGGVEVPVYFTVPTGFALGPVNATTPGRFTSNLQFAIFPQP
jgi:hypothetical protein